MVKILYWNIKLKGVELLSSIGRLAGDVDILIIAELVMSDKKLKEKGTTIEAVIDEITKVTGLKFAGDKKETWLYVWVREQKGLNMVREAIYDKIKDPKDLVDIEVPDDSEYFAVYLSNFERMLFYKVTMGTFQFLLIPIHFPSRIYASTTKQKDISVHFKRFIESIEDRTGLKGIVVGDFNMNPFEPGMIHHEGFHALPSQNLTEPKDFYSVPYKTFYNPSWMQYGDYAITRGKTIRKPCGSYYLESSRDLNYYWYLLDQVIMRKELIEHFCFEEFQYITTVKTQNDLLNKDFTPREAEFSDHLPVKFHLK
jgi:hypothetical protein